MLKTFLYLVVFCFFISCNNESNNDRVETEANAEQEIYGRTIEWKPFDQIVFEQAKESGKLVFLEVGANWCHWCHVMDDSTYSDLKVQNYLEENFIVSRADQDERPDLYAAYKKWGWPAIIVFDAEGNELLKLKGYQKRIRFLKQLKEIRKNPIPITENQNENSNTISSPFINNSLNRFVNNLDHAKGAYNWSNKYLDLNGIKCGIRYGNEKDSLKKWTALSIKNSYALVDPVWSGVYQYSAKQSWNNQHFEKLLRVQANYIEAYALYGGAYDDKESIEKAEEILGYCDRFLSNETPLYWNSQNADLISGVHSETYYQLSEEKRTEKGFPSVDKRIYLKENASIIVSLAYLWAASKKQVYLTKGNEMLTYIITHFKTEKGLFVREEGKNSILSFEDNRRLLDALLVYYQITNNPDYLSESIALGNSIMLNFDSQKGIKSATGDLALQPVIVPVDNLNAALTFNLLGHITTEYNFLDFAKKTYNQLNLESLSNTQSYLPLINRAERELNEEPFHACFISDGSTEDIKEEYIQALLTNKNHYIFFETFILGEMEPDDATFYGGFPSGTLFLCTSSFCSAPITNTDALNQFFADAD